MRIWEGKVVEPSEVNMQEGWVGERSAEYFRSVVRICSFANFTCVKCERWYGMDLR